LEKAPDAFRTISEVADELDLPQHVLRFWETRFPQIKPLKRGGGRRYYRPDDVDLLRGIRHLLYGEGYTIRGVQRIFKDQGIKFVQSVWQAGAPQPAKAGADTDGDIALPGSVTRKPMVLSSPSADEAEANDELEDQVGDEEEAEEEEAAHPVVARPSPLRAPILAARPTLAAKGLQGDDIGKLKATLDDLTECQRMLQMALSNA
jgi:DNA-binding transcriptional MerR regulator